MIDELVLGHRYPESVPSLGRVEEVPGLRGKLVRLGLLLGDERVEAAALQLISQVLVVPEDDSDLLVRLQPMALSVLLELPLLLCLSFLFVAVSSRIALVIQNEYFCLLWLS